MSARKKPHTASPAPDGMPGAPPAAGTVRLRVRLKAGGPERRWRAGLGPFGREPVEVEATQEQADAMRADHMLDVIEAEA